jgi:hypothetical protein
MSKGAGSIERKLQSIFARDPKFVLTTGALCQEVYGIKKVQKKHRVAVLRALKTLAKRSMPSLWRRAQRHERDDVWYDYRHFPGRAEDRAPATERRRPHKQ